MVVLLPRGLKPHSGILNQFLVSHLEEKRWLNSVVIYPFKYYLIISSNRYVSSVILLCTPKAIVLDVSGTWDNSKL